MNINKIIDKLLEDAPRKSSSFAARSQYPPERRKDPEAKLKCPKCDYEVRSAGTMSTHMLTDHDMNPKEVMQHIDKHSDREL